MISFNYDNDIHNGRCELVIKDDRLIIHFVPYPYTLAYFIILLYWYPSYLSTSPYQLTDSAHILKRRSDFVGKSNNVLCFFSKLSSLIIIDYFTHIV